jgi:opacity protein-like surface antigen
MKKILILTFNILYCFIAYSQEDLLGVNEYKQSYNEKSLELQFDPGAIFNSSNTNNVLSNGVGIRMRFFTSETLPLRINLNVSYVSSNTVIQAEDINANLKELKEKSSSIGISLRPGMEKHFLGTKRLSPYIGGELIFNYKTNKINTNYQQGQDVYELKTFNSNLDDGITVGLAALGGVDFYVAKKLYLGLELSYSFSYFLPFKTKIVDSFPNVDNIETYQGKSNIFKVGPETLGVFRIGFLFK